MDRGSGQVPDDTKMKMYQQKRQGWGNHGNKEPVIYKSAQRG